MSTFKTKSLFESIDSSIACNNPGVGRPLRGSRKIVTVDLGERFIIYVASPGEVEFIT